ncbi:MAG: tyrosine-type recombinase/integrase [Gammaproteobacteria bacterium]|nr:tyrosine-type recombinase/integrase [Gammaproteobacteria bacterium]
MQTPSTPWNKGRSVGPKAPLKHYQIWRIRRRLERDFARRDLALFSLALDSMLRASDLLALRVGDVMDEAWHVRTALVIRQRKTGYIAQVELAPYTRAALETWVAFSAKSASDFLFTRRNDDHGPPISAAQYRKRVKAWVASIGLNPDAYSTHSLRRTLAARVYHETKNIEVVRNLLGQSSVSSTSHYLNIGGTESLAVARRYRI